MLAALVPFAVFQLGGGAEEGPASEEPTAAAPDGESSAATGEDPATRIVTRPVTIYQRANAERFALVGTERQVLWFGSAVDRARQIVQHVLGSGDPKRGAMPPAGSGISYQDVYVDERGIAWVDLSASSLAAIRGSDEEQALVACLARSLVEALDEVSRVGILVDGEPRRSLSGHVDLERTYTGSEWPLLNEGFRPVQRDASGGAV